MKLGGILTLSIAMADSGPSQSDLCGQRGRSRDGNS